MLDDKAREIFDGLGHLFADLAKVSDNFILPETDEELGCFVANIVCAKQTGEPLTIYTPLCPDWSRDKQGRYDFKSLGGGESAIAKKVFNYAPELLKFLVKQGVPYEGILIFADWGMETELVAKDEHGNKLSPEEIQRRFKSSIAATNAHLFELQQGQQGLVKELFAPFKPLIAMTDFLDESGLDLDELDTKFRALFLEDAKGKRLFGSLVRASEKVNSERMESYSSEQNYKQCLENLIDYAIFGRALAGYGFIVACESQTSSKAYNLFRSRNDKVPMFFVKGKGTDSAVNIA